MKTNFVIKEGKKSLYYFFLICLFISLVWIFKTGEIGRSFPLRFLLISFILLYSIMLFRWMTSFAVYLDMNKQEIILNHSLFFNKKKILLKDIKKVDVLNGNLILDGSVSLSRWQKLVCKTKKSDDYTVRLEVIDACERRELMEAINQMFIS